MTVKPPSRALVNFYRFLVGFCLLLVLVLLGGTLYGLVLRPSSRTAGQEPKQEAAPAGENASPPDIRYFSGIGTLRLNTAPPEPSLAVISIVFPYDAGDRAFSEELAAKIKDFRAITGEYFASLPAGDLRQMEESALKDEILRRYNAALRLGRIDTLYFGEYLVIGSGE